MPHPLFTAAGVAVSGAGTTYSAPFRTGYKSNGFAVQLAWTGSLTGALTLWASNKNTPNPATDADWVQLPNPAGQPSGEPSGTVHELPTRFAMLRYKYANVSGAGVLSAYQMGGMADAQNTGDPPAVDALSGKGVPVTPANFAAVGLSTPTCVWPCQDLAAPAVDTIGGVGLAAGGVVSFAEPVAGWTRKGIKLMSTTPTLSFASGVGPNPAATSMLWLCYAVPAGSFYASITACGALDGTSPAAVGLNSSGGVRVTGAGGAAGNDYYDIRALGAVPFVLMTDITSNRTVGATPFAIVATSTYPGDPIADSTKGFGPSALTYIVYAAIWTGAAAERTNAQIRTMLTSLGWTVGW